MSKKEDLLFRYPRPNKDFFFIGDDKDYKVMLFKGATTPREMWENKEDILAFSENSERIWNTMTQERQQAIQRMVGRALENMYELRAEWIPSGLDVNESGEYVDIIMRVMFADLDYEIDKHNEMTEFRRREAEKEGTKILENINNETI